MSWKARVSDRGPAHIWTTSQERDGRGMALAMSNCGLSYWKYRLLTPYVGQHVCKKCERPVRSES